MPILLDDFLSGFSLFAAPFLRLSGMMIVAPIFSAPGFNFRTRGLLAVLLAALVAPSLPPPPFESIFSGRGIFAGITEVGVGLIMGFVLQLSLVLRCLQPSAIDDYGARFRDGSGSTEWGSGACARSDVCHFDNTAIFGSRRSLNSHFGCRSVLQPSTHRSPRNLSRDIFTSRCFGFSGIYLGHSDGPPPC